MYIIIYFDFTKKKRFFLQYFDFTKKILFLFLQYFDFTNFFFSELEETLLVLPLDYVIQLMEIMETLLKKDLAKSEIIIRTFFFLTEIHFGPLSSSKTSKILIQSVRTLVSKQLQGLRNNVGFNLAALRHVQNEQDEEEKVKSLLEATTKYKDKKRRKKQKQRAIQTAIISI